MSPSYVQLGSLSSLRSPRRFTAGRPRGPRHGGPGWDAPCLAVQDSEVPGPRGPDKAHPTLLQVPAPHSQRALCIQPALKGYTGATWPEREAGSSPRRPSTAWGAADAQEAFTALSGPTATMSVTGHLEKLPPGGSLTDVTASGELTAGGGGGLFLLPPKEPFFLHKPCPISQDNAHRVLPTGEATQIPCRFSKLCLPGRTTRVSVRRGRGAPEGRPRWEKPAGKGQDPSLCTLHAAVNSPRGSAADPRLAVTYDTLIVFP